MIDANTNTWEQQLQELQQAQANATELSSQPNPTPFIQRQQQAARQTASNLQAELAPQIEVGALYDFNAAVSLLEQASKQIETAKARSESSWDAGRMISERGYADSTLQRALDQGEQSPMFGGGLETVASRFFEEANRSPDSHRQRAMFEALTADKRVPSHIKVDAKNSLETLSENTPEIQQAKKEYAAASEPLLGAHKNLDRVSRALYGRPATAAFSTDPISRAARRIAVRGGEMVLLEVDAEELGGVFWPEK